MDKLTSRIQKFSPNGDHSATVGTKGYGKLKYDWPKGIGIHPYTKNVYITEASKHRVQILTPDFTCLGKVGAEDREGKSRFGNGDGEFNTPPY